MFGVTGTDIAQLNDSDLRELVGRLCIAELRRHQQSSHGVTFGGDQNAADGGIDVRVTLLPGAPQMAHFQGRDIGIQVRKPSMAAGDITAEMRPKDKLRPSIAALAKAGGTYIIVSSGDSTSDTMLESRRAAMRDALSDNAHRKKLTVEFYDSDRLAIWVGDHPGEVLWVRERCGRSCAGWHGYGAWSYPVDSSAGAYLVDHAARLRIGAAGVAIGIPAALQEIRKQLSTPGKALRLVGLSGFGKTSLVQALFDERVGNDSLPQAWAVYTDMGSVTDPHPAAMAVELMALNMRAVLVVDNCLRDVHRNLVRLCGAAGSQLSVITVEYDVREDRPDDTEVVEMHAGSVSLIEDLLEARHSSLSAANRAVIAHAAGGNSRIALALAGTVRADESLAGWGDAELFQRLFWQRHQTDYDLLKAARACALVYSFDGETVGVDGAELAVLASLVEMSALTLFGRIDELRARQLVQDRSQWRALLPPALANRLAEEALKAIPPAYLRQVMEAAPARLQRSFCRRLSYLPSHAFTVALAGAWLSAEGRLAKLDGHDDEQRLMFKHLAPSAPDLALAALERCDMPSLADCLGLVADLAFESNRFERCLALLVKHLLQDTVEMDVRAAQVIIVNRFGIYDPGTMAAWPLRLGIVEGWLASTSAPLRQLGLDTLAHILWRGFRGRNGWSGGSEREGGLSPDSPEQALAWLVQALALLTAQAAQPGAYGSRAKAALADQLPALLFDPVTRKEALAAMARLSGSDFWLQGWHLLQMVRERADDSWSAGDRAAIDGLCAQMAPSDLAAEVLTTTGSFAGNSYPPQGGASHEVLARSAEQAAREIGTRLATDAQVRQAMWPELLCSGGRVEELGQGLAMAGHIADIWSELVAASRQLAPSALRPGLLCGFVSRTHRSDPIQAALLLDAAVDDPVLRGVFPALQGVVGFDRAGIARLHRCLLNRPGAVQDFAVLGKALCDAGADDADLLELVRELVFHQGGYTAALHILLQWQLPDASPARSRQALIEQAAAIVLERSDFCQRDDSLDHLEAGVAAYALAGSNGTQLGSQLAQRLRMAAADNLANAGSHQQMLGALAEGQPRALLDALVGPDGPLDGAISLFFYLPGERGAVHQLEDGTLLDWHDQDPAPRGKYLVQVLPLLDQAHAPELPSITPLVMALFERSADPVALLEAAENALWPSMWEGAHAAKLLDHAGALAALLNQHDDRFRAAVLKLQAEMRSAAADFAQEDRMRNRQGIGRFE